MSLKVGLFLVVLLAVLLIEPSFGVTRRNGGGARSVAQQRRNAPRARSIPRIPPIAPIRAPVSRRQPISRTPIRRRPQARPVVNSTPIRAPVAVPVAVPVAAPVPAPVPVPVPVPVPAPVAAPPAAVAQPSAVQSKAIAKDPKIVDGQPTQISAVPYLVRLRVDGSFNCGGTLVRPNIIVTAAHCVKGIRPGRITVEGGSTRLSTPGVIRPAWKIVTPRGFDSNSLNWDIAVIKLRQPMTGTNIQTIPFCSRALQPGQTALIAGWGTQSENSSQSSDQVRSTTIEMVAKNVCRNAYGSYDALSRTMICAGNRGRRDTCSGDSGGPLVVNRELCGVVSWGNGCGKAAYPGVYTSIRMVQNWINRAMRA